MINRFKTAIFQAVSLDHGSSTSTSGGTLDGGDLNGPRPGPAGISIPDGTGISRANTVSTQSLRNKKSQRSSTSGGGGGGSNDGGPQRPLRREYSRPHFLNLSTPDEIQVTADHMVRPIIVPRDHSALPWNTGYAETINSGKSKKNEDQARVHSDVLKIIPTGDTTKTDSLPGTSSVEKTVDIPYHYFALFDGHAGPGAAVAAAAQLHTILHGRLMDIGKHLIDDGPFCEKQSGRTKVLWFPNTSVTHDSLIVGALEASFYEMDSIIEKDNTIYEGVNGGCTAVVCLFIMGKVFISNAGDSRAILCRRNFAALPLSDDFTPETERTRVRQLAAENPSLLGEEFTSLEFLRRPFKKDIGTKILYRGAYMTGWAYKIASQEDIRFPVVFGQGKRSRVLATIGVTRGFGDHELCAQGSSIRIKPFLSCQPEVRILNINATYLEEDDVIVMGTDGLWDVCNNDTASEIVFSTLDQFPASDKVRYKYRYTSAAQDLVMHARGKFMDRIWKMNSGSAATIDDISVFVIPLWPYKTEVKYAEALNDLSVSSQLSDIPSNNNGLPDDTDIQNANIAEVELNGELVPLKDMEEGLLSDPNLILMRMSLNGEKSDTNVINTSTQLDSNLNPEEPSQVTVEPPDVTNLQITKTNE